MAGYFGTENQKRLQVVAEEADDFISRTPGACQNCRMIGCDDPDLLGWVMIETILERDGFCGCRLILREKFEAFERQLSRSNYRFDSWDLFLAERGRALADSERVIANSMSQEFSVLDAPSEPCGDYTVQIQELMSQSGVVPFSGSMLVGRYRPARTIVVGDANRKVSAVAHAYLPHNSHSPFHRYAWGGLVAVDPQHRGKGLGKLVNALMVVSAIRDLGATHVYEMVSATNTVSRLMVEACGLACEPGLVCGVAAKASNDRFTR